MKIVLVMFLCLFCGLSIFGQNAASAKNTEAAGIESVWLARDDGNGKAGEETEVFSPEDIPIYCLVQLNSQKQTVVKMNLIAVGVAGVKPETKVITVSFKTDGKQNRVSFTGRPEKVWVIGKYRIDIFIDGKQSASREFEVRKLPPQTEKKTQPDLKPKVASRMPVS